MEYEYEILASNGDILSADYEELHASDSFDDGRQKYEGDIIYNQKEYEFEIDANTGDFLEWKEERR